eukprot:TRINITY_DN5575_c0_g1_i2.p2 TRINITY_DN5575_c0_g1~~TRINITY_DN5575_c0_g1_i2.p2  ORF type:complete len:530 (+),score=157.92 TRINITY_DN5575_c0_g1_i2:1723-3312(+)
MLHTRHHRIKMQDPPQVSGFKRPLVDLAPDVVDELDLAYQDVGCKEITSNLRADELMAPQVGPVHPWKAADAASRNTFTGHLEKSNMNSFMFEEQYRKNQKTQFQDWKKKKTERDPKDLRREWEKQEALRKEKEEEDGDVVTKGGEVIKAGTDLTEAQGGVEVTDEDAAKEGRTVYYEENREGVKTKMVEACETSFVRHVSTLYDYQGRNIITDPPVRSVAPECFPPKKLLHTYRGHNKGVHILRWLSKAGHMFASGGLEGKVKLWDVMNERNVIHTYTGHSMGIKDMNFNCYGSTFLTSSHDRFIREWDTETGKVRGSYTNGALANCVKYHPDRDNQNVFFAGCSDKQLHQFDTRTGTIIRSYDQHLGPVNTVTFTDKGRKIVTTSDDKTLRVWEMDLPVTIKQVSDPSMHSLPTATLHPNGKYFGVQSMDNQILIYSATEKFQLNKKKRFSGHVTAGYACEVGFSPDGKYVSSGNAEGELFVWAWGSCKIVKHFKCHEKVLMSHLWHPTESSKLLTCSWDNTIKLWD